MFLRGASICRTWRQQHVGLLLLSRSASGSPANEDLNLEDFAENKHSSACSTETRFGITGIKVRDDEDDDFVSSALPPKVDSLASSAPENYFSKTWEMQKGSSLQRAIYFLEGQLASPPAPPFVPPGSTLNRAWQVAPDAEACTQETFTFASLKVLAETVARVHKLHLYNSVPSTLIDWKSRQSKVMADLEQLSADIICLQELDKFQDLKLGLAFKGYDGLFKASKTGRAPTGCAIFWRKNRFELLHEESIDFGLLDMRNNVAQLCVLQSIVPGTTDNGGVDSGKPEHNQRHRLIVGNIEVLFNPRRGEIKLGQCRAFLQQTQKLLDQWPGAPIVIGGCFHATPKSALYQFLAESEIDLFGWEPKYVSGHLQKPDKTSTTSVTTSRCDILESCVKLQGASRARDENVIGVDAFSSISKASKADGDSTSSSTTMQTVGEVSSGDAVVNDSSLTVGEAPKEGVLVHSNADREAASSMTNATSGVCVNWKDENADSTLAKPLEGPTCRGTSKVSSSPPASALEHGWALEDLKIATGSDNCTLLKHDLKLFSVYPEIWGGAATRDDKGEPCMTMAHNDFKGTVDYIWRSKGLKTTKVLDPLCVSEMLASPVVPFMVSGSDHISLACELAFTSHKSG